MLANFITINNDDARLAYLMHLADRQVEAQRKINEYRDFYAGDQGVELTERQREFLNSGSDDEYRFNVCAVVVESLVERLQVSGFELTGDDPADEPAAADELPAARQAGLVDFADALWESNRMDAGETDLYRQAAIDHVTYIILDIDREGRITFNHNDAYTSGESGGDGEGVKLHYASSRQRGQPLFATKRWQVEQGPDAGYRRHFVIYYPDRIERYYQDDRDISQRLSEALWQRDVPTEGQLAGVWPQPWVDANRQPLGLPVIEFRNARASELAEVVPLQRALNKSLVDLVAAGDTAGFGFLFAAGWVPTSDGLALNLDDDGEPTGNNEALRMEPGAVFYSTNPDAKFNRVLGDDLTRLIQLVDRHMLAVAQVSRTPVTNFQLFGQVPAEGTQRQMESGLLAKAEQRKRGYGNAWEDLIYLARRVALGAPQFIGGEVVGHGLPQYASFNLAEPERLATLWHDTATRSEKEHLETLALKAERGVPAVQIFLEMGYSQQQAEQFAAEAEAQRLAGLALTIEQGAGDAESDQA